MFIPLSLSDMIMVVSGPIIAAVLGRLPEVALQLAAHGVAMNLGLFLECPITMMLHAGTALAGKPAAYRNLGRLLWFWNLVITSIHAIVAFTPAFGWVTQGLLGLPPEIAAAAQPAFAVNLLSSLWVGHRRYRQGQLIYHRRSKEILWAGFCRLGSLVTVLLLGAALGLPGAVASGVAMAASVFFEAMAIYWFTRRLQGQGGGVVSGQGEGAEGPADFASLFRWYLPLMGTQVLVVAVPVLLTAGIARAGFAALSLAAWPIAWSTVRLLANGTRMVQQLTISLGRDPEADRVLRQFATRIGLGFSGFLGLVAFSPLAPLYLTEVIGLRGDLVAIARPVLMVACLLPIQVSLQNWLQGGLVRTGRTSRVNLAALAGGATTVGLVFAGAMLWQLPGAALAAGASVLGICVELFCLWSARTRG